MRYRVKIQLIKEYQHKGAKYSFTTLVFKDIGRCAVEFCEERSAINAAIKNLQNLKHFKKFLLLMPCNGNVNSASIHTLF
jgi:hypothetical protein